MDDDEKQYESDEYYDEDDEEEEEEEEEVDEGEKDDIDDDQAAPQEEGEPSPDDIDDEADLEEEEQKKRESEIVSKIGKGDEHHRIIEIVPPDQRITSEIIQLSEMVEAVGIRISQIEQGSPVFTDVTGLNNPIDQAKKELFDRCSPLILSRALIKEPSYWLVEEWKVREMTFPITTREISKITDKGISDILGATSKEDRSKRDFHIDEVMARPVPKEETPVPELPTDRKKEGTPPSSPAGRKKEKEEPKKPKENKKNQTGKNK